VGLLFISIIIMESKMTKKENNSNKNNNKLRDISKAEILDELENLTKAVIRLFDRVKVLLENLGFFVV